jgi:molybdopterin/thiamine biosynthesis adenylyltransferase
MEFDLAYSRPQKSAEQLGNLAEDRHRFLQKQVFLTGDPEVLATQNGRECLLDSIRLLVRICPNIVVGLPQQSGELLTEAKTLADEIAFGKTVEFWDRLRNLDQFDAILSIGTKVRSDLPWTAINSNGFVARVSSVDADISGSCDCANPVGALAAACLGVGEVFKRLIRLKPERGEMLNGLAFCLRTYAQNASEYGPAIPETNSDLLVVGAGAIGNGIIHLISRLPFGGKITVVDRQKYGRENLGTCILMSSDDLDKSKAVRLAEILNRSGIQAEGKLAPFEEYAASLAEYPTVVLTALDNIDGRYGVQRALWPDVVIDGAIGDFTCQVSRHPWQGDIACLICLFQRPAGRPADEVQSEVTGLLRSRLQDPNSLVTESDVEAAHPEKREFLRSKVGKTVCSVVQQAMAQKISDEQQPENFEPSVPFVACFSACMVMTEALAHVCGWESKLEPRFQFDFLLGPAYGLELPQTRRSDCICGRKKNIERFRAMHGLRDVVSRDHGAD